MSYTLQGLLMQELSPIEEIYSLGLQRGLLPESSRTCVGSPHMYGLGAFALLCFAFLFILRVGGRERGTEREPQAGSAISAEPNAGLQLPNREMVT